MPSPNADWKPGDQARLAPPNLPTCVQMVGVGKRCGEKPVALVSIDMPGVVRMDSCPVCAKHLKKIRDTFPPSDVMWTELPDE